MLETRTIKGEVEAWSADSRTFGKNDRGSRGVKIENDWHNYVGKLELLEELPTKFPPGTIVEFNEKKNKRGYWDIDGEIKVISKAEAYQATAKPSPGYPPINRDKDIQLAVCFKGAIEIANNLPDAEAKDIIKVVSELTEKFYAELSKLKEVLQGEGKW